MRLSVVLLSLLVLLAGRVAADRFEAVVYAVDARGADRFSSDLLASGTKLAAHLQDLKEDGKAEVALKFGGELKWSETVEVEAGEEVEYPSVFAAEGEALTPEQTERRFLGYRASCRALRGKDGPARLQLNFEWTPTFERAEIPRGGEAAWLPRFHTLTAEIDHAVAMDERFVAAMWRTDFPLAENDRGIRRQLFLVMHWTEDSAE